MEYRYLKIREIREEIENLLYPRESFLLKNDNVFSTLFNYVLNILNANVYTPRYIELRSNNKGVDFLLNEHLISRIYNGTKVGKVINIIPCGDDISFFNAWRVRFATNPNFLVNLVRYNKDFIDFVFSFTVYQQLKHRFSNRNIDWNVVRIGEGVFKIILGRSFENVKSIMVSFIPYFCNFGERLKVINEEEDIEEVENNEWLLTDKEYLFLLRYLHGYVLYREGLALSELDITGSTTNKDLLIAEGKEIMEKILEQFKTYHSKVLARRL